MLQPKRLKHRKFQRGRMKGTASGGSFIAFGDYALQAQEPCWMTARQIEAARRAIVHHLKRGGKVWIRVFPDKPVTKKPAEVRMGSGKGAPDHWVAVVRPGLILFEVAGVDAVLAKEAMRLASYKLPIKVKFLAREVAGGPRDEGPSDRGGPYPRARGAGSSKEGGGNAAEGHAAAV